MANTPNLQRIPETRANGENLHYIIEQAGQSLAIAVLTEGSVTDHAQRLKLAELVISVAKRAMDVANLAIAKRWDLAPIDWDTVTPLAIKDAMDAAWTECAQGKFPEEVAP